MPTFCSPSAARKSELCAEEREDIFAYRRENAHSALTVVANFTDRPVSIPKVECRSCGKLLLCNYPDDAAGDRLRPYEARMYLAKIKAE